MIDKLVDVKLGNMEVVVVGASVLYSVGVFESVVGVLDEVVMSVSTILGVAITVEVSTVVTVSTVVPVSVTVGRAVVAGREEGVGAIILLLSVAFVAVLVI